MSVLENLQINTLNIKTPARDIKAFLQSGFFHYDVNGALHRHLYAEVHFILDGAAQFCVSEQKFRVEGGNMLLIPPRVMHTCAFQEAGTRHTAFQIDLPCERVRCLSVSQALLHDFFDAITRCADTDEYGDVAAYMGLLCHPLTAEGAVFIRQPTDYGFLIQEFFSTRYREDIHLSDLADLLHLSERQTERMVLLHTGKTFRRELVATRMAIARHLMENTALSLQEIAAYVGYETYSGFWKALKKEGFSVPQNE